MKSTSGKECGTMKKAINLIIAMIIGFVFITVMVAFINLNNTSEKIDFTDFDLVEVEDVYKEFIRLDTSLVDEERLKEVEKLKELVYTDTYRNYYEETVEFVGLPQKDEAPTIRFIDTAIQRTSNGYKVVGIINQEYEDGKIYASTTKVLFNEDKMVTDSVIIPHIDFIRN